MEDRELAYEPLLPVALRSANRAYLADPARNAERIDKPASYRQMGQSGPPDGVPVSVSIRGQPDVGGPGWPTGDILRIDQRMQRDLALRCGARQRVASRSGHDVHHDEPDVVAEEITRMLKGIRG